MLFLTPLIAKPQIEKMNSSSNLLEKKITIKIDGGQMNYALSDSFIINGSEKISIHDTLLTHHSDYQINYIDGKINFLKNLKPGTEVSISYLFIPFRLQKTYYHRKLIYQSDTTQTITAIPTTPDREMIQRSTLQKNGSIVRGISLGTNQGLKVDSGLRMNISGKITDKVEVVAALTDQTTPIQPEGNTQTLSEIDKVFVQLKSDHFNATLGDYYLSFSGSEFGQYQRKLQGAMGNAQFDDFEFTVSGAVSKGQYTSNQFQGQEGNQGPYQLKGDRGQIDIIVLAGTEKVWIDGEPMTRGENNDYVIEYSTGQITFTRSRLITADSRIVVDFQYSDLQFQRNLYSAQTQTKFWDDKINLDFRFFREADNKDNPLDFTLSDENLEQLQAAGDNTDSAYVSGIRFVGEGKGFYVKVDSADVQFYRYAGSQKGDYNVAFSYVGPGKGDYKSVGFGNYQFVGMGRGSYLPVIFLKSAQSHDLADMNLNLNLRKDFNISGELAASRFDRNTYSTKDDDDNSGLAYRASFNFRPEKVNIAGLHLGKFNIDGKYRVVNSRFNYIDRNDVVEKNRKWDLDEKLSSAEEIKEMNTSYQPVENVTIAFGLGDITKGSAFSSNRWEAKSDVTIKKLPQLHYRVEKIESQNQAIARTGSWIRQFGNTDYNWWKFRPFFNYLGEIKKETLQDTFKTGFKYDELTSGIVLNSFKKMSLTASISNRNDYTFKNDQFDPESKALTHKYQWKYAGGSKLTASAEYIHRDKIFKDSELSDKKTDLGDIQVNYTPFKRAIVTNWHYQISNTQVSKKERVYLKVSQGEGNYRFNEQTEEYEPDDLGDYILRIRQTDDFIPVVELRASSRIQFKPKLIFTSKKLKPWQKWLSTLSTETYLRVEEKTEEKDVWAIYRLDMSKFQQPGKTIFGNNSIRQDIYLLQDNRDFSARFRLENKKEVNFQFLEGGNITNFKEKSIRIIRRFSNRFSSQLDGTNQYRSYLFTARSDKIIEANEMSLDLSYRPKQIFELAVKMKIVARKDIAKDPPTKANEFSLLPRASYSFRGKGKLQVEFEWTKVDLTPQNRIVPYELVGINRMGTTLRWMFGLNYDVSKYIRATISYNGRREPDRSETIHVGRAEMRAYF